MSLDWLGVAASAVIGLLLQNADIRNVERDRDERLLGHHDQSFFAHDE